MTDIKSMNLPEVTALLVELGEPSYRGGQVFQWLHRGAASFDHMANLPKTLRGKLSETCLLCPPKAVRVQEDRSDGTRKYLWELSDGNCVESVLMRYRHGNSVCISSQVGCRMGCAFCASTVAGKVRNLTAGELLDQVLFTGLDAEAEISNIVLMGIGEPLDNLDAVLRFLELVNCPEGLSIGMRHISLSTCGLIPGIRRLAELQLQLTLSVSLHAPDSETRSRLMPVNRAYDVEELFAACHDYFKKTGRRISFEYALIDGVNDHDWQADRIAEKLRGMPAHVNLIPLNEVVESPYRPSRRMGAFQKRLNARGVTATVRRSLGGEIDAACGQLRRRAMEQGETIKIPNKQETIGTVPASQCHKDLRNNKSRNYGAVSVVLDEATERRDTLCIASDGNEVQDGGDKPECGDYCCASPKKRPRTRRETPTGGGTDTAEKKE